VTNEEKLSKPVPIQSLTNYLFHLQSISFMIRNNLSASELNHPKTQEYFHQINHLLELFNQTNSEKDIAEWDYSFLNNTVEQNKEFNDENKLSGQEKGSNDDAKESEDSKSNTPLENPPSDPNSSKFFSEYILQNNSKQNEEFIVSLLPPFSLPTLCLICSFGFRFFSKL
jgi:hypothetical protein